MIEIKNDEGKVLFREAVESLEGKPMIGLDLRRAQLERWSLRNTVWHGTDLSGANLRGANLRDAQLRDVNLCDANLQEANLRRVAVFGSCLENANLRDADLSYAHLQFLRMASANLECADLSSAILWFCDVHYANLQGSALRNCLFRSTSLRTVDLKDAYLNWNSHEVIGRILWREALVSEPRFRVQRCALASLVLESLDWCWDIWKGLSHSEREWALGVLRPLADADHESPAWLRTQPESGTLPGCAGEKKTGEFPHLRE